MTGWDPYLDLSTGVPRNRLGITDRAELARAEAELTALRLVELRRAGLPGRYDLAHLRAFHRFIFGDVYDWAGEPRTVSIGKGQPFCLPQHIESFATEVFGRLAARRFLRGLGRGGVTGAPRKDDRWRALLPPPRRPHRRARRLGRAPAAPSGRTGAAGAAVAARSAGKA